LRVTAGPSINRCARRATFTVYVSDISRNVGLRLRITDCDDDDDEIDLVLDQPWNVYFEDFGKMTLGESRCHQFTVEPRGNSYIIDSIVSPSALFTIRYTARRPPVRVYDVYHYDVCFKATRAGVTTRPILVYLHRNQPAGGYSNFIVADTAYVDVRVPAGPPAAPKPVLPKPVPKPVPRKPVLVAVPPPVIIQKPVPKPDTAVVVRRPDIARVGLREFHFDPVMPPAEQPAAVRSEPAPALLLPEFLSDPTPFRTILLPTARSIGQGKGFVASYDLAGWLLGYGLTDRLSLLGGFLYVPRFISNTLAVTAGAKYEFHNEEPFRLAAGMQFNFSRTDLSSISLASPYLVGSVGDDDQRASLTLGYSWRHHEQADGETFGRRAAIVGIGGDYRIGFHWKLAAEAALLESSDLQPLIVTARYFSDSFTIDFGVGANLNPSREVTGLRVGPIVNAIWVW
jgi:hypothetical protein